jgi:hypothetical protein
MGLEAPRVHMVEGAGTRDGAGSTARLGLEVEVLGIGHRVDQMWL